MEPIASTNEQATSYAQQPMTICPEHVFIAVVGTTGSGKTHFISQCTQRPQMDIGDSLASCTVQASLHSMQHLGRTIHMIDTPGFDDTNRTEAETLQELSYWLAESYEKGLRLNGIVYLHRITDPRMQGSSLRALSTFKKICGKQSYAGITLATTRWDEIQPEQGQHRHAELCDNDDWWGDLIDGGAYDVALKNGKDDIIAVVERIARNPQRLTLALQIQLVDEKRSLDETDAGKALNEKSLTEQKFLESSMQEAQVQLREALYAQNEQSQKEAKANILKLRQSLDLRFLELQTLRVGKDDLVDTWEPRIEEEKKLLEEEKQLLENLIKENLAPLSPPISPQSGTDPIQKSTKVGHQSSIGRAGKMASGKMVRVPRENREWTEIVQKRKNGMHASVNTTSAVVGTGIALGQLVAMAACSVM